MALRGGRIAFHTPFGTGSLGPGTADLSASVQIRDIDALKLLSSGSAGLGEGYIKGQWETADLLSVLRIAARDLSRFDRVRRVLERPRSALHRLRSLVPLNDRSGARSNVGAHYDLGNNLFASFLDPRMQYSCAVFEPWDIDLEDAQLRKLDLLCSDLALTKDDHLIEIGGGWGGLALHAAGEYGCRVTTTTISEEQRAFATRLVDDAGLGDRVRVVGHDYRDLDGSYSKLVSVEMIEAVGWQYFDAFFAKCASLIPEGGAMALQAITIRDSLFELEKSTRTFANTHVFPGGCLPSEALIAHESSAVGLCLARRRDIGHHYARTLEAWRERFRAAWPALRENYDEQFRRLWDFYLTYCEAGFRERRIGDVQLLFTKP